MRLICLKKVCKKKVTAPFVNKKYIQKSGCHLFCLFLVFLLSACQKLEPMDKTQKHPKELSNNNLPNVTPNRLINEKSPYLLQHADNPVDWYPWGEEAFAKAKKENKPIFLSIGYSTCHWCHVMEHESFENKDIAAKMNEYFVSIKVDREERPDIDNIYMTAVQTMTGSGGWPLTVLLTPDKKPFFGGTYFSPVAKWGQPGLMDIMESVHAAWEKDPQQFLESSQSLTNALKERTQQNVKREGENVLLGEDVLTKSYFQYQDSYDSTFGGFGHSPKFPTSHNLSFLLRYWKRTGSSEALDMVEHTLKKMAEGGMYDHLGGGFHRYSTDHEWQVPHFEKMLYDQAILARTYLEAYQITKNEFYAGIAREIFDYVLRDMQYKDGGFFSAEDADSYDPDDAQATIKKEGAFYVWRDEEIITILGEDAAAIFNYHFGVEPSGNAHSDPHAEFTGKNIIYIEKNLEQTAEHFQMSLADTRARIKESKQKLFEVRNKRPRPYLDDKILVDWNGLMISSLAFGSKVLQDPKYSQAAEKAAQFIEKHLITKDDHLKHRYRDGDGSIEGMIEDYAFFIHGLLDLYETTFEVNYLKQALRLATNMIDLFWDEENGGFYFTADGAEELLFRSKEIYDGAVPSGNSFAALDLVRLYHLTLDDQWKSKFDALFQAFAKEIEARPSVYAQMMMALDFHFGPSQEIVIAGDPQDQMTKDMVNKIYEFFLPNKVLILRPADTTAAKAIIEISPYVEHQGPLGGPTAYVCENFMCKLPVKDVHQLEKLF